MNWEYTTVAVSTVNDTGLQLELNALGSLGWEVVGFASVDRTIGLNTLLAVLKRETHGFPPPASTEPAWHPDPAGRSQQRYFDGFRWTQHIVDKDGMRETDYPTPRG